MTDYIVPFLIIYLLSHLVSLHILRFIYEYEREEFMTDGGDKVPWLKIFNFVSWIPLLNTLECIIRLPRYIRIQRRLWKIRKRIRTKVGFIGKPYKRGDIVTMNGRTEYKVIKRFRRPIHWPWMKGKPGNINHYLLEPYEQPGKQVRKGSSQGDRQTAP